MTMLRYNGGRYQARTASFNELVKGNRKEKKTRKNTAERMQQIRARKIVMEGLCPESSVSL